jgi:hypothetical protein
MGGYVVKRKAVRLSLSKPVCDDEPGFDKLSLTDLKENLQIRFQLM